jgi:diguanylate cyclase (GGDEF)-like protein
MTRTAEILTSKESEDLRHMGETISKGSFSADPLLPELSRLFEYYNRLEQHAEKISNENQRIKTQLVEMSRSLDLSTRIDVMTGLVNRRDILGKIEQEFSRAQRHQRTFSVILADIDDFRLVNDNFGFNAGDEVLVEIANVMRVCIRSEDICARWGGEEFLLLLPETGIDGAQSVAGKICHAVSMTEFRVNKPGIRVTLSLGVSEYNQGQATFDCIAKAGQALLQAKHAGKNRFMVAPMPETPETQDTENERPLDI